MIRDASQKQVIQKFSFIENLTIPQAIEPQDRQAEEEIDIDIDPAFNFIPQVNVQASSTIEAAKSTLSKEDSALVAAVQTATNANSIKVATETSYPGIEELIKYSGLNHSVSQPSKHPNYLGKILFALASGYCLFAVWWLFGHQGEKFITRMMGGRHITMSRSEVEFIDYMERSLLSLDRQIEANNADADKEKVVYVPVYTPKDRTPEPVVQPQLSPQPEVASNFGIPAPPPLPTPADVPESNSGTSPNVDPNVNPVVTQPAIKHILTGILDLGVDKSAALIKVNGQTRRFAPGETIGNSGLILESIVNQTVTISDRGQIRSIAVGESF